MAEEPSRFIEEPEENGQHEEVKEIPEKKKNKHTRKNLRGKSLSKMVDDVFELNKVPLQSVFRKLKKLFAIDIKGPNANLVREF